MNSIKPKNFKIVSNEIKGQKTTELKEELDKSEYFEWKKSYYKFKRDNVINNASLWWEYTNEFVSRKDYILKAIDTYIDENAIITAEQRISRKSLTKKEKEEIFKIILDTHLIKKNWEILGTYSISSLKAKVRCLMKIEKISNKLWFLPLFLLEWGWCWFIENDKYLKEWENIANPDFKDDKELKLMIEWKGGTFLVHSIINPIWSLSYTTCNPSLNSPSLDKSYNLRSNLHDIDRMTSMSCSLIKIKKNNTWEYDGKFYTATNVAIILKFNPKHIIWVSDQDWGTPIDWDRPDQVIGSLWQVQSPFKLIEDTNQKKRSVSPYNEVKLRIWWEKWVAEPIWILFNPVKNCEQNDPLSNEEIIDHLKQLSKRYKLPQYCIDEKKSETKKNNFSFEENEYHIKINSDNISYTIWKDSSFILKHVNWKNTLRTQKDLEYIEKCAKDNWKELKLVDRFRNHFWRIEYNHKQRPIKFITSYNEVSYIIDVEKNVFLYELNIDWFNGPQPILDIKVIQWAYDLLSHWLNKKEKILLDNYLWFDENWWIVGFRSIIKK